MCSVVAVNCGRGVYANFQCCKTKAFVYLFAQREDIKRLSGDFGWA